MPRHALMVLVSVSFLTLIACSPADNTVPAEPAEYAVVDGWVRKPLGGRDVTAGFITLTAGAPGGQLVAAETAEAEHVEIHTVIKQGDVMRMRPIKAVDIPPAAAVSLAPGGDHLMIFGVKAKDLADGEMALTLAFADGETLSVTLPVRDTAPDLHNTHGGYNGHP